MLKLTCQAGANFGHTVIIDRPVFTIGRKKENDLQIMSPFVSKFHAKIISDDSGAYWLDDLQSTNGTYLNSQKLERTILLAENQSIIFGRDQIYSVEEVAAQLTVPEYHSEAVPAYSESENEDSLADDWLQMPGWEPPSPAVPVLSDAGMAAEAAEAALQESEAALQESEAVHLESEAANLNNDGVQSENEAPDSWLDLMDLSVELKKNLHQVAEETPIPGALAAETGTPAVVKPAAVNEVGKDFYHRLYQLACDLMQIINRENGLRLLVGEIERIFPGSNGAIGLARLNRTPIHWEQYSLGVLPDTMFETLRQVHLFNSDAVNATLFRCQALKSRVLYRCLRREGQPFGFVALIEGTDAFSATNEHYFEQLGQLMEAAIPNWVV